MIPHYESHWDKQNQMRLENYPQCATQWTLNETHKITWRGLMLTQFPRKNITIALVLNKIQCDYTHSHCSSILETQLKARTFIAKALASQA